MQLSLVRDTFTDKSTTGKLFVDDVFECYVLEDVVRTGPKVYGKTAIPEGEYELTIDYSPKYDRPMMHILGVPNFEGIRIHAGNYAGNETFYKKIPLDIHKGVLYSEEYIEVFDDEKTR